MIRKSLDSTVPQLRLHPIRYTDAEYPQWVYIIAIVHACKTRLKKKLLNRASLSADVPDHSHPERVCLELCHPLPSSTIPRHLHILIYMAQLQTPRITYGTHVPHPPCTRAYTPPPHRTTLLLLLQLRLQLTLPCQTCPARIPTLHVCRGCSPSSKKIIWLYSNPVPD